MTTPSTMRLEALPPAEPRESEPHAVLDEIELGTNSENVTLSSGRRYELAAGHRVDQLTVRSASGRVLLRVAVGDEGPVLSFESAHVTLSAHKRLTLSAPEVSLEAGELRVYAGHAEEIVEGDRHTHVRGEDRLEAGAIAMQASSGDVRVRAHDIITLDGEHIGLNDDPCPTPFDWSELAREQSAECAPNHEANESRSQREQQP